MKIARLLIVIFCLSLTSCGVGKRSAASDNKVSKRVIGTDTPAAEEEPKMHQVVNFAQEFLGTKYKYGGTTNKGMDCSGLIYISFLHADIPLPRSSRNMAEIGRELSLSEVELGDLLFFETDKRKGVINHVGLVVGKEDDNIRFIHSSTSLGVIISGLEEKYWRKHYVMARRVH